MPAYQKMLRELVLQTGAFRHIYDIDGHIFLVNEVCDLTGFCVPSLRRKMNVYKVDYEYGIAVPHTNFGIENGVEYSLLVRRHVVLPKTIPVANSLDMLTNGDRLSEWLVTDMVDTMRRFTLPREQALRLIEESDDRLLNNLMRVYQGKFTSSITEPLVERSASAKPH